MCLKGNVKATEQFYEQNKELTVYKVVYKKHNYCDAYVSIYYPYHWRPGKHTVNEALPYRIKCNQEVHHGFHVFLKKPDKFTLADSWELQYLLSGVATVIELKASTEDLIAVNEEMTQAVFRTMELPAELPAAVPQEDITKRG